MLLASIVEAFETLLATIRARALEPGLIFALAQPILLLFFAQSFAKQQKWIDLIFDGNIDFGAGHEFFIGVGDCKLTNF